MRRRLPRSTSHNQRPGLLEDAALTEVISDDVEVATRSFANRLEAARFLDELITAAGISLPERNRGLWTWVTLFFFDEVCPADGHGRRDPQDEARLLPLLDIRSCGSKLLEVEIVAADAEVLADVSDDAARHVAGMAEVAATARQDFARTASSRKSIPLRRLLPSTSPE